MEKDINFENMTKDELVKLCKEFSSICQEFINKVENLQARSVHTYGRMKKVMQDAEEIGSKNE